MNQSKNQKNSNTSIDRRKFIKVGSTTAFALAVGNVFGGRLKNSGTIINYNFELQEITIRKLHNAYKSGKLSIVEVVKKYLERIEKIDQNGPSLRSVIEINPDALKIASQLDKELKAGHIRGILHGIPVLIKMNIGTADRMTTTAGSLALEGATPQIDAGIVKRMRNAGIVILGKTNLSEWANFRSTRSSSGWSSQGGQTKNPYALDRNPCGSSSGSGVAVSANLCTVAVGTETDGSIVCPSNANGIVGIKPTVGLLSRSVIIPISHTQDTAGPMARSVEDAAALLTVMAGKDPYDKATNTIPGQIPDYTKMLKKDGLKGARIGISRNFFGFHEKVDKIINKAIDAMRDAGATLIDPANIETKGKMGAAEFEVLLYEFKTDLNNYLASYVNDTKVKTLEDIIKFNENNSTRVMPYFGQEIFLMAQKKGSLTEKKYLDALKKCRFLSRKNGIDATLKKYKLDAIIAPTGGPAWVTDLITGDHFLGSSSEPAAIAGYPSITVPVGFIFGLPVGISFIGSAWQEAKLIKFAYAFEQTTKARKSPKFLPTADLET